MVYRGPSKRNYHGFVGKLIIILLVLWAVWEFFLKEQIPGLIADTIRALI